LLSIVPSVPLNRVLNGGPEGLQLTISAAVSDSALGRVSATVNWRDGTTESFPATTGTLAVSSSRLVKPGFYAVTLRATNARYPVPDSAQATFSIQVHSAAQEPPPSDLLIGPILPRDSGAPNAQDWIFNSGSGLGVLESSVKMLLSTQIGERLMSDYGCRLTAVLFEPGLAGVESQVREEIVASLAAWEPRVRLLTATVDKTDARSVRVDLLLQSVLTEQNFGTFLEFQAL